MTKLYKSLTLAAVIVSIVNSAEAGTVVRWFKEAIGGGGNPAGMLYVTSPIPTVGPPITAFRSDGIDMDLGKVAVRQSCDIGAGGDDTDTASVTLTPDRVADVSGVVTSSEGTAHKVGKQFVINIPDEEITGGAGIGTRDSTTSRPEKTDDFVAGCRWGWNRVRHSRPNGTTCDF
jgi:hypothetical protein